jgi:hypothetical protein
MRSFLAIGLSVVAGSAMTVLGATAGAQSETTTADAAQRAQTAQQQADDAQARAADLSKQGGWVYKTGTYDRANQEAIRSQAQADDASAQVTGANTAPLAVSPTLEEEEKEARLQSLKQQGGWAYKSGAIRREEADIRHLEGPSQYASSPNVPEPPANWNKPVEQVEHPAESGD